VHYPTDINLLFDATRKVIELTARLSADQGMSDWRQHAYNVQAPEAAPAQRAEHKASQGP
jgi:IS5 family transposase